jgi:hypothetical protein
LAGPVMRFWFACSAAAVDQPRRAAKCGNIMVQREPNVRARAIEFVF